MPFLIGRHRQRGVNQRDDRLRKIWGAAIADPLRITSVHHETGRLECSHMAGHAGLAGAEIAHQFANAMLASIPQHPKSFEPDRLGEGGKDRYGKHGFTRLCAYAHKRIYSFVLNYARPAKVRYFTSIRSIRWSGRDPAMPQAPW